MFETYINYGGIVSLGFDYRGKAQKGFWRLKFTGRKDRFATKIRSMKKYLRGNLNTENTFGVIKSVIQVVTGWVIPQIWMVSLHKWMTTACYSIRSC